MKARREGRPRTSDGIKPLGAVEDRRKVDNRSITSLVRQERGPSPAAEAAAASEIARKEEGRVQRVVPSRGEGEGRFEK